MVRRLFLIIVLYLAAQSMLNAAIIVESKNPLFGKFEKKQFENILESGLNIPQTFRSKKDIYLICRQGGAYVEVLAVAAPQIKSKDAADVLLRASGGFEKSARIYWSSSEKYYTCALLSEDHGKLFKLDGNTKADFGRVVDYFRTHGWKPIAILAIANYMTRQDFDFPAAETGSFWVYDISKCSPDFTSTVSHHIPATEASIWCLQAIGSPAFMLLMVIFLFGSLSQIGKPPRERDSKRERISTLGYIICVTILFLLTFANHRSTMHREVSDLWFGQFSATSLFASTGMYALFIFGITFVLFWILNRQFNRNVYSKRSELPGYRT